MTAYYVQPGVGSDSNAGNGWGAGSAWATLKKAADTAAAGDTIYMSNGASDVITVSTTYVFAAGVRVISTSDTSHTPPQTYAAGAGVSSTTFGIDISINGTVSMFGISLATANSGTTVLTLNGGTGGDYQYYEDCTFNCAGAAGNTTLGVNWSNYRTELHTRNCSWQFGAAGQYIEVSTKWKSEGDTFCGTGAVPTRLFQYSTKITADAWIVGADLSNVNTTLVAADASYNSAIRLASCKLHASVTPLSGAVRAGTEVSLFDCSYDNAGALAGYLFYHENYLGSTTISTSVYANDGAQYDGTNRCSWVVAGKSNASKERPYESPWIDFYNAKISTSITPYLECVRSGSSTAYKDDEVWGEFMARATGNSPAMALQLDRAGPLTAGANQDASSKTGADWTGENATSWFGKLVAPAAFTPAEVGIIRARVCVAGANTVYVDPQLRGLA